MTPVEDRTRAAMDAIMGLVESVPPLTLPPPGAASRSRRHRGVSWPQWRWGSWLAPAAAAAAVLAVAFTLVAVRDMPGARPPAPATGRATAPVSVPQYYLTFSQPPGDTTVPVGLVLDATLTGKKLATLQPPGGLSFAGVTGAADDRTFVADAHRDPYGVQGSQARSRTWYLVRVTGAGARAALTMRKLPIRPTPVGTVIAAIALSPDAAMLAVVTMPYTDNFSKEKQVLRVYSVATGSVLHSWSTGYNQVPFGGGGSGGDPNAMLAWIGDHALIFNGDARPKSGEVTLDVMELDLSHPDGDLLRSSRTAAILPTPNWQDKPAPFGCRWFWGDVMITGDGKSYVCGGSGTSGATLPKLYCLKQPTWNTVAFAGISLATGKLTRFLSGYRTGCHGGNVMGYPVWVSATGSTVIGYMIFGDRISGRFGAFSHGSFRPLPIPVPGNSYQYMDGSLLNQVAW